MAFDPNDFLQQPDFMLITPAAAKAIDVAAIRNKIELPLVPLSLWIMHRDSVADQLRLYADKVKRAGSGVFITDMRDNLSVVDTILPPKCIVSPSSAPTPRPPKPSPISKTS